MQEIWAASLLLRREMVRVLGRVGRHGFDPGEASSLSVRTSEGGVFLFCSNSFFSGRPSPEVVELHSIEGNQSEPGRILGDDVTLHRGIYSARKDINAVLMAQPPYATSFAAMGRTPDSGVTQETLLGLDDIGLSENERRAAWEV